MRMLARHIMLYAVLFALLAYAAPVRAQAAVAEEDFTVTLGDGWVSKAKLTYPAGQNGPFPTVLLLVNPDVDMDFRLPPNLNDPIYKDLAESLSARGIAVARYNPRYVNGPGEYGDEAKVFEQQPPDMLADAEAVLATIRQNPRVDTRHTFVWGWSFSSLAAAALAAKDANVAGLILVGPVAEASNQDLIGTFRDVTLPYLQRYAPDGRITPEVIQQAQDGDGGFFTKAWLFAVKDGAVQDKVVVNPFFDKNGDGVLEINSEILPNLDAFVDADPFTPILRSLPSVAAQAPKLNKPVLVLQGENDAASRPQYARALEPAFAGRDFTLKLYPGLGHSLTPVNEAIADRLSLYADQPKADIAAWVLARSAAPAALPRTGGDTPVFVVALFALGLLAIGGMVRRRRA
jgi:uncharacterized protein